MTYTPTAAPVNEDGMTRNELLENNAQIVLQEGGTQGEVYLNSIETRLALPLELRTEEDEHLGDAYVAVLADNESEVEPDFNPFLRFDVDDLVINFGVTRIEAAVVYFMANLEYVTPG